MDGWSAAGAGADKLNSSPGESEDYATSCRLGGTEASVGMNIGLNSDKGQFAWRGSMALMHRRRALACFERWISLSFTRTHDRTKYVYGIGLRFAAILLRRITMMTTKITHRTAAITRTIVGFIDVRSPYFLPSAAPLEPFPTVEIVTMTAGPEKQHKNTPKASQGN